MQIIVFLAVVAMASAAHEYLINPSLRSMSNTTCVCTTVPCPVSGANTLTESESYFSLDLNIIADLFSADGGGTGTYNYAMHNGHAVVTSASVTITAKNLDQGTDTTSCTQDYSRTLDDDGVKDCDAGHILAHRLGGPGNQPINIFPQVSPLNQPLYVYAYRPRRTCQ